MNPSDFQTYPWSSVLQNGESEIIALNIITILKRTGDEWRSLEWVEYEAERKKDGGFSSNEAYYFDEVQSYTVSAKAASSFCAIWAKVYENSFSVSK